MPLSGSVGLATRSGSTEASAGLGLRPRRRLPVACSSATRASIFLLPGRGGGGLALQLRPAGAQPRQTVLAPRQSLGQRLAAFRAEQAVLAPVGALRLGHHARDLLADRRRAAVRLQRGIGLHLGAVQHHQPEPEQAGVAAHLQHPHEDRLQPLDMASPEARDHRVVRHVLADDEAVARIAPAQPLDGPARAHAVAVGVDQHRQQHRRRERRLARTAELVRRLEGGEVHQRHRLQDQMHDVVLGQPVPHVRRQQEGLAPFRATEVVGHASPRARSRERISPGSPTQAATAPPPLADVIAAGDSATASSDSAIVLCGLPDLPQSLPHGRLARR
jgi:hypothetical protein